MVEVLQALPEVLIERSESSVRARNIILMHAECIRHPHANAADQNIRIGLLNQVLQLYIANRSAKERLETQELIPAWWPEGCKKNYKR